MLGSMSSWLRVWTMYVMSSNLLSVRLHLAEALLTKLLDPVIWAGHSVVGDVDNDTKHQPQVDYVCLLAVLQLIQAGLDLDVEADGV